jgi:hypothetical protein
VLDFGLTTKKSDRECQMSRTTTSLLVAVAGCVSAVSPVQSAPSVLERLLAERIVLCWLEVHCLDPALSPKTEMPVRHAEFCDRRRDRAHRRYLSALRSLATIRRLLVPSVQLNIGSKQVNIAQ